MIKRLEINNYKLFRDFSLDLDEGLALLCGPNGSGKTSILEVIYALTKFLAMPDYSDNSAWSVEKAFPLRTFCRWLLDESGHGEMSINLELDCGVQNIYVYMLSVRHNFSDKSSRVQHESLALNGVSLFEFREGAIDMLTDDAQSLSFKSDWNRSGLVLASGNNSRIREFGRQISLLYAFHLIPALMEQNIEKPAETLGLYGENFAAWRFLHATKRPMKQAWVVEQSKYFIPGLVDIGNVKKGDWHTLVATVKFDGREKDIEFGELSDGQKILLSLYTIVANIPNGSTVIIDEPENFLAPGELQPWLETMNTAREERDIQFIVISHNPKTLNWHNKNAIIFRAAGNPPKVCFERHVDRYDESLMDKLHRIAWDDAEDASL